MGIQERLKVERIIGAANERERIAQKLEDEAALCECAAGVALASVFDFDSQALALVLRTLANDVRAGD